MNNSEQNPVIFVGAGPGGPELITMAGKQALEEADLVVYAGSLVSPEMLSWCKPEAEVLDSAGLKLDEIVTAMVEGQRQGGRVVRLQTGDISLYGALQEQISGLNAHKVPWRIIPGVTAAFAAAAILGLSYTLPEITQSLIFTRVSGRTSVPDSENLAALAAHGCSLAIYLAAECADQVTEALSKALGPEAPAAIVYRASWPQERVIWSHVGDLTRDLAGAGIKRQALILVGPTLNKAGGLGESRPSRLYDGSFSHGYRPLKGK
ncbi:MAG: precorrin-4 C(11)-methyltransferase [Desulfarculaceae bacterium]|jgi:precorrin-4/cobalt-precorrin-4 C11-methyltransferase